VPVRPRPANREHSFTSPDHGSAEIRAEYPFGPHNVEMSRIRRQAAWLRGFSAQRKRYRGVVMRTPLIPEFPLGPGMIN
jgi:hypothetical protein